MTAVGTLPQWLAHLALAGGVLLSAVIIVVLSLRDRAALAQRSEEGDDGSPPASNEQIVGSACVACGHSIRTVVDGGLCRGCERPIHRACLKEHRRDAHAPPPKGTYR